MTFLIAVVLLRLGSSVSMVVILLGTVKDGSSYDDCEDGGESLSSLKDGPQVW